MCVTGTYLMIHLKEAGEDGMNGVISDNSRISSMSFAGGDVASGELFIPCKFVRTQRTERGLDCFHDCRSRGIKNGSLC